MNEIIVRADTLRDALTGALVAVDADKNLPAFNCVKVTATPSGVDVVGTNRYLLVCGTVTPSNDYDAWRGFDALIHMDDVKAFIAALKDAMKLNKNLGIKLTGNGYEVALHGIPDVTLTARNLNSQFDFPRYERLWPDTFGYVENIGINPALFAKLDKIPRVKDTPVKLQFVGENRAIKVHVDHDAIAWQVIAMPVRVDK
jgi:DNA polymerase III sliding clamp (beta) subunit (PCNA family)